MEDVEDLARVDVDPFVVDEDMIQDADAPVLETGLDDAQSARDSTDIASGVPEGEAEVLHQPTTTLEEVLEPGPVAFPEGAGSGLPPGTFDGGDQAQLPADDPVSGPGLPEPRLPGQGEDGPSPGLATLAAWAGVLIGAVIVLDRVGVVSW